MSSILPWLKCGTAVFATIVTEAVLTPVQADALATAIAEAECDPSPCRVVRNYRAPVQLKFLRPHLKYKPEMLQGLFIGDFAGDSVTYFQRAFDALSRVPTAEFAVFETCCRVHTAKLKGDRDATLAQQRHKRYLIRETAGLKMETHAALAELLAHLEAAGVRSRAIPVEDRLPAFRRALRARKLPDLELKILRGYGISDTQIQEVCKFVLKEVQAEDVPRTFEEFGRRLMGIMRRNDDIEQCRCAEQ